MVRLHPGSLGDDWSVSVSAAHVCGKDGDRVQFPDGPIEENGALVQREDAWLAPR